jgi:hypothetical protein
MNTTLRCTLPILSSLVMIAVSAAQNAPAPLVEQPSIPPTVTGALEHSRSVVFDTPKQSCNSNDIPDAMARAFRDSKGTVHLVAASSQLFQSIGPTLEIVTHSCDVGHDSANDPHPADFNDQTWIDSFYTFDGKTIAGLTHTEYHGWAHPGRCAFTNGYNGCEYDSDTYSESNDGGYHFNSPEAPKNFLAGVPFKYVHDAGPSGYSVDSNIIERDGWFYAMVTS